MSLLTSSVDQPSTSVGTTATLVDLEFSLSETLSLAELDFSSANASGDLEKGIVAPAENGPPDPHVVNWDGPDDPLHPYNWPRAKKIAVVGSISAINFVTPLGSSMFAPGIEQVMGEFNSTSPELSSFVVSIFLLGFALGPLLVAPLSELHGRAPLYHICNLLFILFNVACAMATNLDSFILFRFLSGCAGSAPLAIGAGSLADIVRQERRGTAMAAWAMGPVIGPVVGPIVGGYLMEGQGWRWTFWLLAMMSGAVTMNTFFWMTESYHPVLLARKTKRLIKETGNPNLRSAMASSRPTFLDHFVHVIVRPTKMLIFSPIVLLLSVYVAVAYGYLYLLFTTISDVFMNDYGISQGNVGLTFMGMGVGTILGLGILAFTSDRILTSLTTKHGGDMKPEYRLPPMFIGAVSIPAGLFWYGWSVQAHLHYMMPIIGTLFVGLGLLCCMMPTSNYLVDAYPLYAASATAANTVLRSIAGAVLPLAGRPMYQAVGLGWGNSLLAFIAVALAPVPFCLFYFGERIRKSKRFQLDL